MPTIKLTDNFGLDLDVVTGDLSGLAKQFGSLDSLKLENINAALLSAVQLGHLPVTSLSSGLNFSKDVPAGPLGLSFSAGVQGTLSVQAGAGDAVIDDHFSEPIKVSAGEGWVGVQLQASGGVTGSTSVAPGKFGFDTGGSVAIANYQPFPSTTRFDQALMGAFGQFAIPDGPEAISEMPLGRVAVLEGNGHLKFSASANLLAIANPLVAQELPLGAGKLSVGASVKVTVGASFELKGGYQVRLSKLSSGKVHFGIYRQKSVQAGFTASAGAGINAKLGDRDLIALVMDRIANPASGAELLSAGLSEAQVGVISGAVKGALNKKLELSASFAASVLKSGDAAFLFEIDPGMLEEDGISAIREAFRGDLTLLTEPEDTALPAGIRLVRGLHTATRQRQTSLRINLLGIFNFVSMEKLTLSGKVLFEPESGDLIITDTASASRVQSASLTIGADAEKLRSVLAESFLLTAVYRCTKAAAAPPALKSTQWYCEVHARTNRQTMKDNLDVPEALGLLTAAEKQERLPVGLSEFGRTTLLAEASYNDEQASALFLKPDGSPRTQAEYDAFGLEALAALVQPGDEADYRRTPAVNPTLWKRMTDAGPVLSNLKPLFPSLDDQQILVISSDYVLVRWWSEAMSKAAAQLADLRKFLAENPGAGGEDEGFRSRQKNLAKLMAGVVKNTKAQFGDPWGLIAMDRASGRVATAHSVITSASVSVEGRREGAPAVLAAGAPV